jgi:AraC-like DNA-binding protein
MVPVVDRAQVTVSARVFVAIVAAGRSAGVEMEPILARLGIDEDALSDPDGRLPLALEDALWEATAEASGDPCFGLHAATQAEAGDFDVFGYALRTSPTLRHALHDAARYNRLLHDVALLELVDEGELVRITHRFRGDPMGPSWHAADYTMAALVVTARALTGVDLRPVRVALIHPAPDEARCYRELFGEGVPIAFGAPRNEVVFHRDALARPVVGGDPGLHAVLRRHADDLLSRLPKADDLPTRVRERIAEALQGGDPSLEAVARQLGASSRTLQRRLSEHGLRYQDLLDELRRELAYAYLRDDRMAIGEVAYLLGFGEPRAFHRAFKRWTGTTPAAWRRAR